MGIPLKSLKDSVIEHYGAELKLILSDIQGMSEHSNKFFFMKFPTSEKRRQVSMPTLCILESIYCFKKISDKCCVLAGRFQLSQPMVLFTNQTALSHGPLSCLLLYMV